MGGYLIWHVRDMKVFIDSRVDIFEYSDVFADYIDLMAIKNVDKILDKYQIQFVLLPVNAPLTQILERDPHWRVEYRDSLSVLLEKSRL